MELNAAGTLRYIKSTIMTNDALGVLSRFCLSTLLVIRILSISGTDIRVSSFVSHQNTRKDYADIGDGVIIAGVRTAIECSALCLNYQCMGFNVCQTAFEGLSVKCEIFKNMASELELKMSPCQYYEQASPCLNGGQYIDGEDRCECLPGYVGNRCHRLIRDCTEASRHNLPTGEYDIQPKDAPKPFRVHCQNVAGGMTYLMYRTKYEGSPRPADFFRSWQEYKHGFGEPYSNFWLGNEYTHQITRQGLYTLDVGIATSLDGFKHAYYEQMSVGSESEDYAIHVGAFQPWSQVNDSITPSGDSARNINGKPFSTHDRDVTSKCPQRYQAGWWFAEDCTAANLNGQIGRSGNSPIAPPRMTWEYDFKGIEITGVYMQIRAESYYDDLF